MLVDLFHTLNVDAAGFCMVYDRLGVVHANSALCGLLHALRSIPRIVNILGRKSPQNGQVAPGVRDGTRSSLNSNMFSWNYEKCYGIVS